MLGVSGLALDPSMVLFGTVFVLGTYVVATLDDLIHMSASRSFVYIWFALAGVFGYLQYAAGDALLQVRVALSVAIVVLFHVKFIPLPFKLAIGDCIAMLPVVFLLPLMYVGVFVVAFLFADQFILRTWYVRFLRRSAYPFMPALFLALAAAFVLMYRTGEIGGVVIG